MEESGNMAILITSVICSTMSCYPNNWIHSKHSTSVEKAMGKGSFSPSAKGTKECQQSCLMTWEFFNAEVLRNSAPESEVLWEH